MRPLMRILSTVQAMDIAGLKKITAHTLLMIVSVFGFMVLVFVGGISPCR